MDNQTMPLEVANLKFKISQVSNNTELGQLFNEVMSQKDKLTTEQILDLVVVLESKTSELNKIVPAKAIPVLSTEEVKEIEKTVEKNTDGKASRVKMFLAGIATTLGLAALGHFGIPAVKGLFNNNEKSDINTIEIARTGNVLLGRTNAVVEIKDYTVEITEEAQLNMLSALVNANVLCQTDINAEQIYNFWAVANNQTIRNDVNLMKAMNFHSERNIVSDYVTVMPKLMQSIFNANLKVPVQGTMAEVGLEDFRLSSLYLNAEDKEAANISQTILENYASYVKTNDEEMFKQVQEDLNMLMISAQYGEGEFSHEARMVMDSVVTTIHTDYFARSEGKYIIDQFEIEGYMKFSKEYCNEASVLENINVSLNNQTAEYQAELESHNKGVNTLALDMEETIEANSLLEKNTACSLITNITNEEIEEIKKNGGKIIGGIHTPESINKYVSSYGGGISGGPSIGIGKEGTETTVTKKVTDNCITTETVKEYYNENVNEIEVAPNVPKAGENTNKPVLENQITIDTNTSNLDLNNPTFIIKDENVVSNKDKEDLKEGFKAGIEEQQNKNQQDIENGWEVTDGITIENKVVIPPAPTPASTPAPTPAPAPVVIENVYINEEIANQSAPAAENVEGTISKEQMEAEIAAQQAAQEAAKVVEQSAPVVETEMTK